MSIVLLVVVAILAAALVAALLRRTDSGEAAAVRQHLELMISQQAETVQRVERSLREQEQNLVLEEPLLLPEGQQFWNRLAPSRLL